MAEPVPCVVCGARFTPSTGRFWCSVACEAEAVRGDSPERDRLRDHLLARVREVYGDPELHTDHVGLQRAPGMDRWRVVSGRSGVVGVAETEIEALRDAVLWRPRG